MSQVNLKPELAPAHWSKVAGASDKGTGIGDGLKQLNKLHEAIDGKLFETAKLKTADEVDARLDALQAAIGKTIGAAISEARKLSALARKCEVDFKKKPDTAKTVAPAAATIAKEAAAYAAALDNTSQAARGELTTLLAKLRAEEKKNEGEDEKEEGGSATAWLAKTVAAVRKVPTLPKADEAKKPFRFLLGIGKGVQVVFVARISGFTGETYKKLQREHTGAEKLVFGLGDCTWDATANKLVFTFKGTLPGSAKKALKLALKDQCGKPYDPIVRKLVKQKDGSEAAQEVTDDNDPGDSDGVAGATGNARSPGEAAGVEPGKAFEARRGALMPRIQAAIKAAGPDAEALRNALVEAGRLAQEKKDYVRAGLLLDGIERKLAAAGKPGGAPAGPVSVVQLSKARGDWADTRAVFVNEVKRLLDSLSALYREEPEQGAAVVAAKKQLLNSAGKVTADLENRLADVVKAAADPAQQKTSIAAAKRALEAMEKLLADDPLMKVLDGNEVLPDMVIVKPMQQRLKAIAAALG